MAVIPITVAYLVLLNYLADEDGEPTTGSPCTNFDCPHHCQHQDHSTAGRAMLLVWAKTLVPLPPFQLCFHPDAIASQDAANPERGHNAGCVLAPNAIQCGQIKMVVVVVAEEYSVNAKDWLGWPMASIW
jgi:hypothetical protein